MSIWNASLTAATAALFVLTGFIDAHTTARSLVSGLLNSNRVWVDNIRPVFERAMLACIASMESAYFITTGGDPVSHVDVPTLTVLGIVLCTLLVTVAVFGATLVAEFTVRRSGIAALVAFTCLLATGLSHGLDTSLVHRIRAWLTGSEHGQEMAQWILPCLVAFAVQIACVAVARACFRTDNGIDRANTESGEKIRVRF
jgi:uncharacterized membrane protein